MNKDEPIREFSGYLTREPYAQRALSKPVRLDITLQKDGLLIGCYIDDCNVGSIVVEVSYLHDVGDIDIETVMPTDLITHVWRNRDLGLDPVHSVALFDLKDDPCSVEEADDN